jgi:hypothetical protein
VKGVPSYLLLVLLLFAGSGASCPRSRQLSNDYAPVVLTPDATLADIIRVVNANSARIHQLQSNGARLTVDGAPALQASYAFERPRRFRLRAELSSMTGPELDLGSNDEQYWIWARRSPEPAIYWGRHDEFYQSSAREILPVAPGWFVEALGVVELDPTGRHEGPFRQRPGQLEIRTLLATAEGGMTKITVVDDARGWVIEQHLLDASGRPLASSQAAAFQFDPVSGVSLPRLVEIRLPPAQMTMTLETESHQINRLVGDPNQLWTIPTMRGVPLVDLNPSPRTGQLDPRVPDAARPTRVADRSLIPSRDPAIRRLPPFDRLR